MNIITLTWNPAFDMHCNAPGFSAGRENAVCILSREAGGKGINISRALSSCGVPNLAYVTVGKENGEDFCRMLVRDGVAYISYCVPGRIRENITLHTPGQPETRISFSGFAVDTSFLQCIEGVLAQHVNAETILTVTGRLPEGLEMIEVLSFLKRICDRGARIVIDSQSFTLTDLLAVKPFLIKPNEEEVALYFDRPIYNLQDAVAAAADLQVQGIENVMISLGAQGAALVTSRGSFMVAAPHINPISTIGAGDSSIAGFLAALCLGKNDLDCLRTAVAYGSAACLRAGTLPPLHEDVERLLATI